MEPLIRSFSTVTAALAKVSLVVQLIFFLVVCSCMTLEGFGFVDFLVFVNVICFCIRLYCLLSLSAKGAHPYRKRARMEALRVATTNHTQRGTGYPS
jgi:hypothetical protein